MNLKVLNPMLKSSYLLSLFLVLIVSVISIRLSAEERPNVVIILADDLGIGDVSSFNEDAAWKTPNIDKLAARGKSFSDAHTNAALCTPTRYGILTGRYSWRTTLKKSGYDGYSNPLIDNDRMTIAELYKDNGYNTSLIGKWHLGLSWQFKGKREIQFDDKTRRVIDFSKPISNGPEAHGFMYSFGTMASLSSPPFVYVENSRPTSIPEEISVNYDEKAFWRKGPKGKDFEHVDTLPNIANRSVKYIEEQAKDDKPFFLYCALTAPHAPIIPTTEFIGKSNASAYGDFVLLVDKVVGQIVDAITEEDRLENTLIFFTSDNGQSPRADFDDDELPLAGHNGSYIYRGKKFDIYEGGHRVPFIASWPGKIEKGSHSDETICTVDFMATAAELLGVSLPDDAAEDSYSFVPALTQTKLRKPIREATVMHSSDGRFAIRKGDWKLILWAGSGGWAFPATEEDMKGLPKFQLYNLKKDPSEKSNLVSKYPKRVSELKALLEKYVVDGRSTPGTPQKNDGPASWPELEWME